MQIGRLQMNHVGSFCLLFFLSVFQPPYAVLGHSFPREPVTLLALFSILFYKICATVGFKQFWENYKLFITLVGLYQVVSILSLWLNYERYENISEFIRMGLPFFLIQGAMPVAVFLFLLPQNDSRFSLTLSKYNLPIFLTILALIPLTAFWQIFDSESAQSFYKFFIAGDIENAKNIRSILAISTDLGAVCGLFVVSLILYLRINRLNNAHSTVTSCMFFAVLFLLAGLLSGARIFLLILSGAYLFFLCVRMKKSLGSLFSIGGITLSLLLLMITFMPSTMAYKFGEALPAIHYINFGLMPNNHDWLPQFSMPNNDDFGRLRLWLIASELLLNNPLLGLTNGAFRLELADLGGPTYHNTHNFVLQVLIDSGVLGLLIIATIIVILMKRLNDFPLTTCLLITLFFSLNVDYFADHSLPWIIITTFILVTFYLNEKAAGASEKSNLELNPSKVFGCLLICLTIAFSSFFHKRFILLNGFVNDSIESVVSVFWRGNNLVPPLIVADRVGVEGADDLEKSSLLRLAHKVNTPCKYQYPGTTYVTKKFQKTGLKQYMIHFSGVYAHVSQSQNVEGCPVQQAGSLELNSWLSNHSPYFEKYIKENQISLLYPHVKLFSPLIQINDNKNIFFEIVGQSFDRAYPSLLLDVVDARVGNIVSTYNIQSTDSIETKSIMLTEGIYYLRLAPKTIKVDKQSGKRQSIILKGFSLEP